MGNWKPASEPPPMVSAACFSDDVLVLDRDSGSDCDEFAVGHYDHGADEWVVNCTWEFRVTHWTELPEPPGDGGRE